MSSSDEELLDVLNIMNLNVINLREKRKRRFLVRPSRKSKSEAHVRALFFNKELNMSPDQFETIYKMKPATFKILCDALHPFTNHKDTNWKCVSKEERLLITLRYFATGISMKALSCYFLRGHTTIRNVITETTKAISLALQPLYLPRPTEKIWKDAAERYWELTLLPNCIGSLDAKYIRVQCPPNSGSDYNCKGFHSIVVLGVADADGNFLSIDVGELGIDGDVSSFKEGAFVKDLMGGNLEIPHPRPLPSESTDFPFYFAAGEAFLLQNNVMQLYPKKNINSAKTIFNGHLSRGRKPAESAFGMLFSKFRILETPIKRNVTAIDDIVQAVCVLHNFVRYHEEAPSQPKEAALEEIQGSIPRLKIDEGRRATNAALQYRDHLCEYFVTLEGAGHEEEMFCNKKEYREAPIEFIQVIL